VIDVISPCVAFNNNDGSTKSYDFVRAHNAAVNKLDFIEGREEITASYGPGTLQEVAQHDGSVLRLRKLREDYDPTNRIAAMTYLQEHHAKGEVVTGLLFVEASPRDLHASLGTVGAPLNSLSEKDLCPGNAALAAFNESYR
jgi:2-oxoglutarate ferredoxin oxidoreductase subunit beta